MLNVKSRRATRHFDRGGKAFLREGHALLNQAREGLSPPPSCAPGKEFYLFQRVKHINH